MIKPAYSVSFLLSINIFVWQNVLYFPNDPPVGFMLRTRVISYPKHNVSTFINYVKSV